MEPADKPTRTEAIAVVLGSLLGIALVLLAGAYVVMVVYNVAGLSDFFGTDDLSYIQSFGVTVLWLLLATSLSRKAS